MSENTFVLPADVVLTTSGDTLTLRYPGNVVLEQDLGLDQLNIDVGGDLDVNLGRVSGTLRAGGVLGVAGMVDGGTLHGAEVQLGDAEIRCRAISATERIIVGRAKLQVDVIIAPQIEIDSAASGRVTVIESDNERGPTKIKGGFSLEEYESVLGGDVVQFLAERNVAPLGEIPPPAETPEPPRATVRTADAVVPRTAPVFQIEEEEEDIDDPLSLSTDDLVLVQPEVVETEEVEVDEVEDELFQALTDAVARIIACYEETVPPPVEQLQDMVARRDYAALREDITEVWNGLLGYHQQRGIRPHHQVTHAFNVIHGLLQPA